MRRVIFGLVASGLTVYNLSGDPILLLFLIALTLILMSLYAAYHIGYIQGKKELLDKMNEVIELINESNESNLRINEAFGNIKPFEILQKEGYKDQGIRPRNRRDRRPHDRNFDGAR